MPVVYSLTDLTGRNRNENRRTVIVTFEVKRRTFLVTLASIVASLPITAIVGMFAGIWALLVPVVFIVVGLWAWDSRQRQGLKLLNYQAIVDSRKVRNGVLYAAGQPVPTPTLVMHQRQFVPLVHAASEAPVVRSAANLSAARERARSRRHPAEARYL